MQNNSRQLCRRFLRGHCEFGDQCCYWHSSATLDYYGGGAHEGHYGVRGEGHFGGRGEGHYGGRGRRGGGHSFSTEQYWGTSDQGSWQRSEAVYRRQEWGLLGTPHGGRQNGGGWEMAGPRAPPAYGQRGRGFDNAWRGHSQSRHSPFFSSQGRGAGRVPRQRPIPANFDGGRKWSFNDYSGGDGESILVMSYNVLSAKNAKQHKNALYNHIPWQELHWRSRWAILEKEIRHWSADIIALQEVDEYHDVNRDLSKLGYEGVFSKRSGGYSDGCAIFWRKRRFRMVEQESIDFGTMDMRNNAAQLLVLQSLAEPSGGSEGKNAGASMSGADNAGKSEDSNVVSKKEDEAVVGGSGGQVGRKVVVSNIHVLFNPKRGDIKLGQLRVLTERVQQMTQKHGGLPTLMCGDFNLSPNSALYNFIANAHLDCRSVDRRYMSGQLECTRDTRPPPRNLRPQRPTSPPLNGTGVFISSTSVQISITDKNVEAGTSAEVGEAAGGAARGGEEGEMMSISVEAVRLEQLGMRTPEKARRAVREEEATESVLVENGESVVEVSAVKRMRLEIEVQEEEREGMEVVERREGEEEVRKEEGEGEAAEEAIAEGLDDEVRSDSREEEGVSEAQEDGGYEEGKRGKKFEWGADEDSGDDVDTQDVGNGEAAGGVHWDPEELYLAVGKQGESVVSHALPLKSAYTSVKGGERTNEGEPLMTSFHAAFMGTVDYIWHTPELHPVRVLEPMPVKSMQNWAGLPRGCWASDHFALVAEFKLVSSFSTVESLLEESHP